LVKQVASNESQEFPISEGLVTYPSGAWPYEAVERGLARPAARIIKTGGGQDRNDY